MATVYSYLPGFLTGAGLSFPVVMKDGGLNLTDYITQLTITVGTTTIGLGDLVMVKTGVITADVTVAKDFTAVGVVLDTNRNKATLEAAGTTVAYGAAFAAGDIIDVLLLVPGMVLSLNHDGVATIDIGEDVRCAAAGNCAALAAIATDADPSTKIGMSLSLGVGTGTEGRIAVMIK